MTEAEFSRRLINRLNYAGYCVTRVESHGTSVGIPDMFIVGHGFDVWIELKVVHENWEPYKEYTIPWRPGQQAWASEYYRHQLYKKNTLTVVKFNNGMAVVPMDRRYDSNKCSLIPFDMSMLAALTLRYEGGTEHDTFEKWLKGLDENPEKMWKSCCPAVLKKFYIIEGTFERNVARCILANSK